MEQIEETRNQKSDENEGEKSSVHLSSCDIGSDVSHLKNSNLIGSIDSTGQTSNSGVESTVNPVKPNDLSDLNTVHASDAKPELQVAEESQERVIPKASPNSVLAETEQTNDSVELCESECVLGEKTDLKEGSNDDVHSVKESSGKESSDGFLLKDITDCGQEQLNKDVNSSKDGICVGSDLPTVNSENKILEESTEDVCSENPQVVLENKEQGQSEKESELKSVTPSSEVDANNIALPCELQTTDEPDEVGNSSDESKKLDRCDSSENSMQTTATACESDLRPTDESSTKTTLEDSEETDIENSNRSESSDIKNASENNVHNEISDDNRRVDSSSEKETITLASPVLNDFDENEHNTSSPAQEAEHFVKDITVDSQTTSADADISYISLSKKEIPEKDTEMDVIDLDEEERILSEDTVTSNVQRSPEGESQISSNIDTEKLEEEEHDNIEMSNNAAGKSDDDGGNSGDTDKNEEFFKKDSEDADMSKEIEEDDGDNSCDMQASVEFIQIDSDKDENSQLSLDRTDEDTNPYGDKDPFAVSNDKDSIGNSNDEDKDAMEVEVAVADEDKDVTDGVDEGDKDAMEVAVADEDKDVSDGVDEGDKDAIEVADEDKDVSDDVDEGDKDAIDGADGGDKDAIDGADGGDNDSIVVTAEEEKEDLGANEEEEAMGIVVEDENSVGVVNEGDKDIVNDANDEEEEAMGILVDENSIAAVDEGDKDVVHVANNEEDEAMGIVIDENSIAVVDEGEKDIVDDANEGDKDIVDDANEGDKDIVHVANEKEEAMGIVVEEDENSIDVADEGDKDIADVVNEEDKDVDDKDVISVGDENDRESENIENESQDVVSVGDTENKDDEETGNEKDKDIGNIEDTEDNDVRADEDEEMDVVDIADEEDQDIISVADGGDEDSITVSNEEVSVAGSNEKIKDPLAVSSEDDKVASPIQNEDSRDSAATSNGENNDDLIMDQEIDEQPMEVDETDGDDISIADLDGKTTDDMEEPGGVDISAMCETVLEESASTLALKNPDISNRSRRRTTKSLDSGDTDIVEIIDTADTEKENEKQRHPSKNRSGGMKGEGKSKNFGASRKQSTGVSVEEVCIIPDSVPRVLPGHKEAKGKGETPKGRRGSKSNEVAEKVNEKPEVATESRRTPGRPQRQAAKRAECQIKEIAANDEESQEPEERVGRAVVCDGCFKLRNWVTSYKMQINGTEKMKYFCSQDCATAFKRMARTKPTDADVNSNAEPVRRYTRKCAQCSLVISGEEKNLSWETMDFCHEECLGKYQKILGSQCANCKGIVASASLGKYCVRFGYDVKQFCCSGCLEEFKKGLKVCSYCQKDISGGSEGFLAPVGDKGQFKDFCTQSCMEKYDQMSNNHAPPVVVQECAVCNNEKVVSMEVVHKKKVHKFCSEPCFAAFRFVNGMIPEQCYMCKKFFDKKEVDSFAVYSDDVVHCFCSKTCMNVYILANRKIVPCHWCKVKKYNFDMIKRVYNTGQLLLVCSLNCLSLYQVGGNVVSTKRIPCDFCNGMCTPQYNLNMSDNTVRNFCCYQCVTKFQDQFSNTVRVDSSPFPTGVPKRYIGARRSLAVQQNETQRENVPGVKTGLPLPVISSVQSLASDDPSAQNNAGITTRSAAALKQVNNNVPQNAVQPTKIVRQIIVRPPEPKSLRNKAVTCRPTTHTKGTHCRPIICTKETQTESTDPGHPILIPVPVPIYVPTPMCMYSSPFPVPVPFPLPVPVPIFIPTTRNSAKGIIKEIKRIQEKIPADPFEAELLMMAEIVAGEKKEDNSDSDSDAVDNTEEVSGAGGDAEEGPRAAAASAAGGAAAAAAADGRYSPETVDNSNTFGDDMLQMALKMATELEEPTDLEAALTPTTITSQPATNVEQTNSESEDDPEPVQPTPEARPLRGRKRSTRTLRSSASTSSPSSTSATNKRRRVSASGEGLLLPPPEPPQTPVVEQEKPDANMCLKFTLGVNAWKRWVLTKNAELEKAAASNRKLKLFKPEILQQTADELNYSLCLFVKEVRKPNGQEYAPDTIYYLCLGIQQYLFESGRIDNIFTDPYYEKFTECLDEVAKKFSTLYNDSQYIVTRVEEEHLWESKQLGAHSPHVLLSTLMFFNTKHFNLTTVEEHMQLSFSHIMKHWKRNPNQAGTSKGPGSSRNVLLRFYPPQSALEGNSKKKKVYEQQENEDNPLRCPVKLYEFYLSKCPESVKTRNDVFYLLPERSCVPDSPVWYSTMALGKEPLMKMLHRVKMVKEINQALLKS